MEKQDVKKIYAEALEEIYRARPDLMVIDADLARIAGSDRFAKAHPEAHVQVGIAEQDLVGIAGGIAQTGRLVYASAFCNFLAMRSCDQVSSLLCYNELNVKLCGTYAGISSGINGGTHISVSDVAILRSFPGMMIADPADGYELKAALLTAAETEGPVYIRIPKGPLPPVFPAPVSFTFGKGVDLTPAATQGLTPEALGALTPTGITLVTSGIITYEALLAVRQLAEEGLAIRLLHMGSVKPLDESLLLAAAAESRLLVTAENHSVIGGLGSAVLEALAASCPRPVIRLGIQDEFCEGQTQAELLERHGLSAARIAGHIRALA